MTKEEKAEYNKKYNATDKYKAARKGYDHKYNTSEKGRARSREGCIRHRLKHPQKALCRSRFTRAVLAGDIKRKPCVRCGSVPAQGHHEDYSKPLDVIWLCREHHHESHKAERKN